MARLRHRPRLRLRARQARSPGEPRPRPVRRAADRLLRRRGHLGRPALPPRRRFDERADPARRWDRRRVLGDDAPRRPLGRRALRRARPPLRPTQRGRARRRSPPPGRPRVPLRPRADARRRREGPAARLAARHRRHRPGPRGRRRSPRQERAAARGHVGHPLRRRPHRHRRVVAPRAVHADGQLLRGGRDVEPLAPSPRATGHGGPDGAPGPAPRPAPRGSADRLPLEPRPALDRRRRHWRAHRRQGRGGLGDRDRVPVGAQGRPAPRPLAPLFGVSRGEHRPGLRAAVPGRRGRHRPRRGRRHRDGGRVHGPRAHAGRPPGRRRDRRREAAAAPRVPA